MQRSLIRIALGLVFALGWRTTALGGGGPENVVVVVNAKSWASRTIANEFIKLREIPRVNVIYLDDVPDHESVSIDVFREKILKPVFAQIGKRRLDPQIDYVVWSADFPTAVDLRSDMKGRKLPRVLTPTGSITGLTYLFQLSGNEDAAYYALNTNRYVRNILRPQPVKAFGEEEKKRLREAAKLLSEKKWEEALEIFSELRAAHPHAAELHYNTACCAARVGREQEAIDALARAVEAGWYNHRHTLEDDDLESLRESPQFQKLIERMQEATFDVQPTRAFRSLYRWTADGKRNNKEGLRYVLSTMLAVTSGRGNSVEEALESLRRSKSADATFPEGSIYFLKNGNVRAKTREPAFRSAVEALRELDIEAEIVSGTIPLNKNDVQGAVIGIASFDWESSGSTILPGAICEHLTSFGGVMREGASQTPLSAFIRHGAAGASGTVTEPFAIQAKFPSPFIQVHYARGASLAEAFYMSVAGPYQLLVVGDPLCQPWAEIPKVTVEGLEAGATVSGEISLTASAMGSDGTPATIDHYEVFANGRRVAIFGREATFKLDTTKLPDGYHELRVVGVLLDPLETQGRAILPITVNNRGRTVTLDVSGEGTWSWNRPARLTATAPGASEISILQNGERVAHAEDERVTWETDSLSPMRFGYGPASFQAAALYETPSARGLLSEPVEVSIDPGMYLKPLTPPERDLRPGLAFKIPDRPQQVVRQTKKARWLNDYKKKTGESFQVEGYFRVPEKAVYQFHVKGNPSVRVEVDGTVLAEKTSEEWAYLPVALEAGLHRVAFAGSFPAAPELWVRFGGPGMKSLNEKRFLHAAVDE